MNFEPVDMMQEYKNLLNSFSSITVPLKEFFLELGIGSGDFSEKITNLNLGELVIAMDFVDVLVANPSYYPENHQMFLIAKKSLCETFTIKVNNLKKG